MALQFSERVARALPLRTSPPAPRSTPSTPPPCCRQQLSNRALTLGGHADGDRRGAAQQQRGQDGGLAHS